MDIMCVTKISRQVMFASLKFRNFFGITKFVKLTCCENFM